MSRLVEHSIIGEKPFSVVPLANGTRQQLERMILTGVLAPGAKLNEVALAKTLGVSRGPIREATRALERSGLVTVIMNRGAYVRVVSLEEAMESYVVAGMLFAVGSELCAEAASSKQKAELKKLVDDMDRAIKVSDQDKFFEDNVLFHEMIVDFSGNGQLSKLHLEQTQKLALIRRRVFDKLGSMPQSNVEHRAVLDAILRGDPAAARRHAETHNRKGRARFLKSIDYPDT